MSMKARRRRHRRITARRIISAPKSARNRSTKTRRNILKTNARNSMSIDPVCGMEVDEESAAGKYDYKGRTYLFCNPHCLDVFKENPEKFLAPADSRAPEEAPPGAAYICPMDPEVRGDKPGPCPKCGMALEPLAVAPPATRTEYVCP